MLEFKTVSFFEMPDYVELLLLRQKILRTPDGTTYSMDELASEAQEIHRVLVDEDKIIAGYLIRSADGRWQMRQVAVDSQWQGRGIGSRLIADFERLARKAQVNSLWIEARLSAVPFYLKNGYHLSDRPAWMNPDSTLENKGLYKTLSWQAT